MTRPETARALRTTQALRTTEALRTIQALRPTRSLLTTRRRLVTAGAGAALGSVLGCTSRPAPDDPAARGATPAAPATPAPPQPSTPVHRSMDRALAALEQETGRTIGVVAGDGRRTFYGYRSGTPFPMCSTFKTLLVGALLRDHADDDGFWQRRISFSDRDLVVNSPVTSKDADRAMSVAELADAALRWSDNTAGNLLLREVGGPRGITAFARELGASATRLDRWEPDLNEALPGDDRDTSTPADLHRLFGALLLGDALDRLGQARLRDWMLRNRTSGQRLGRDLPPGVELADKTGAGAYGVVNDVGVFWAGERQLCVAVLTRTDDPAARGDDAVVARVGRLLRERWLA